MASGYRAFQFALHPTAGQQRALTTLLAQQCALYNAAMDERRGAWRLERRRVTRYEQFKTLTGMAEQEPALFAFGVTVARGTLFRLDRAFEAFFRRTASGETPGFPRYRSLHRFDSAEWPDTAGWKLDESATRLYLRGVGHVKVRLHRPLRGTPKTVSVTRVGKRWLVTVFCADVPAQPLPPADKAVGVDAGVSVTALSDGRLIDNPRALKRSSAALARAQRVATGRAQGSARRRKATERVARLHRKIANQRKDFLHKQSRALINDHDVVVVEDLAVGNMTRRARPLPDGASGVAAKAGLNRSILDAAWGTFRQMLTYKAEEAGRELIVVDPRHTSQKCAECGHVAWENRHGAEFACVACGYTAHADTNAAVNILRAGLAQRLKREAERSVTPCETDHLASHKGSALAASVSGSAPGP